MHAAIGAAMIGAAMIGLAGCDKGAPSAKPSASASVDVRTAWLDVAKCMRANGYPNFPDPIQNAQSRWEIQFSAGSADVPACDALVRKAKQADIAQHVVSAADMAKLQQYARCIREHGVPNFPDPDSNGNFDLPQGMRNDPSMHTAQEACTQYAAPARPK